ncbi:MAG TPA: DUF4097 family beta strand repeat-containing protein [Gemmatimonadales bacterium]|nr:DUF4097 family beta strand repeat-containing protein [Gemmatimonadales bacterium]
MRPFLFLVPAVLLGAATMEAQQKDSFDWKGRLGAGKTLEIRGINGDIRVTAARGDEAVVRATKSARKGDVSRVQIKVEEHADGVTICTIYPGSSSDSCTDSGKRRKNHSSDDDNNDVVVDFTVEVPANVRFEGGTVNGGIDAQGLRADATVSTVNGGIVLATTGVGSATTVNGSVRLRIGSASWDGQLDARTVNGSVTVEMPAPTDLEVEAATLNGSISSDFPLTLQGKMSPQKLRGTIGKGGRQLHLETVNGDVSLRKAS